MPPIWALRARKVAIISPCMGFLTFLMCYWNTSLSAIFSKVFRDFVMTFSCDMFVHAGLKPF